MALGLVALILAGAAAAWLLWRNARADMEGGEERTVTLLKGVIFLGLSAALFAVKLWPLAFMTLLAAGGVTAIELWRKRSIAANEMTRRSASATPAVMQPEEAASILGVSADAPPDAIRAAHKRLIGQLHPDKGGSDYLAAKINGARDVLLALSDPRRDQ